MSTKEWDKMNRYTIGASFYIEKDKDIIEYIEKQNSKGVTKNAIVRLAIKEYMSNHKIDDNNGTT